MADERLILGISLIIIGLILFSFLNIASNIWGLILILTGIALIIFRKEEDKIEQRKDIKTQKT